MRHQAGRLAKRGGFAQNSPKARMPQDALLRTMGPTIAALLASAASLGLLMPLKLLAQEYPADISRGKVIYERHCMTCHGPRGYGDGPNALLLTITPANFHRPGSFMKSDESLLRMIEHGGVFSPMHSWRGRLTDGQMQDVLAYIRLLSQDSR
jgi:mono/diheme cytochrome c family protein